MAAQGLVVVGVNQGGLSGTDSAHINAFISQTGATFPVVEDLGQSYGQYGYTPSVSPFPLDVVIDRTGRIVFISRGYNAGELRAAIEKAL